MENNADPKLRILIATGLYPPDIGGPATYTVFLEKHMPGHGIKLEVLPFSSVRKYPRVIRHVVYLYKLIYDARHFDYLYALDTVSVGFPVMLASWLTGVPYLLRVPGDYAWEQGQQRFGVTQTLDEYLAAKRRPLLVRVFARIQNAVAKHAYRIIVPSDYMKGVVSKWGVDPKNITRIYSALKVIDVPESKEDLRRMLGHEGFVIITAARLVPWKGVSALITTVCRLRELGIPAELIVVGDGTERAALEAQMVAQRATPYVHFLGTLNRDALGKHLKAADAFVLNTSYEGLSHQLLEVMHVGVPIVTTPVGGNVELVMPEVDGLMVSWNDVDALVEALMSLYGDPALGARLARHASERVELFHEDRVVKEFVSFIQSI